MTRCSASPRTRWCSGGNESSGCSTYDQDLPGEAVGRLGQAAGALGRLAAQVAPAAADDRNHLAADARVVVCPAPWWHEQRLARPVVADSFGTLDQPPSGARHRLR